MNPHRTPVGEAIRGKIGAALESQCMSVCNHYPNDERCPVGTATPTVSVGLGVGVCIHAAAPDYSGTPMDVHGLVFDRDADLHSRNVEACF